MEAVGLGSKKNDKLRGPTLGRFKHRETKWNGCPWGRKITTLYKEGRNVRGLEESEQSVHRLITHRKLS